MAIETSNIDEQIIEYASTNHLDIDQCDFTLTGVKTSIKAKEMNNFGAYNEILQKLYHTKESIIKHEVVFKQKYAIELHQKKNSALKLDYEVRIDRFAIKPKIVIRPTSKIPYTKVPPKTMLSLLYKELQKIKAKHRLLVNLFNEKMLNDLKLFVKIIYAKKFVKNVAITLFEGVEPEFAAPSELIEHYKKGKENETILEVAENQLIVEYIKPSINKSGFSAYGELVRPGEDNGEKILDFEVDYDSIEIKADDKFIKLYSKKKGFVEHKGGRIKISNVYQMTDFKRTGGNMQTTENSDIEVVVTEKDSTQDSVGEGAKIKTDRITIDGFVGMKAEIQANSITINGATHNGSIVKAKEATINCHRGTLSANKAKIKTLEGGTINASNVEVDLALGGAIHAKNVIVHDVRNHLKIYATESVTIHKMKGEDNKIYFDYKHVPAVMKELKFILNDIEELKEKIEDTKKHSPQLIPDMNTEMLKLKKMAKKIEESSFDATLEIKEKVQGINVITYYFPKDKFIEFRTKPLMTYAKFNIEHNDEVATLNPVGVSVELG
jgi:hypothetical protein